MEAEKKEVELKDEVEHLEEQGEEAFSEEDLLEEEKKGADLEAEEKEA